MMKDHTKGRIHKTSLFIQPEYKCRTNCPGCYAIDMMGYESNAKLGKAIDEYANKSSYVFDQVTLSLNNLRLKDTDRSVDAFNMLVDGWNCEKENFHVACDINSLGTWNEVLDMCSVGVLNVSIDESKMTYLNNMKQADFNFRALAKIRLQYPDLHINWNYMLGKDAQVGDILGDGLFETMLNYDTAPFNSLHLVMEKPTFKTLGNMFDASSLSHMRSVFLRYLDVATHLKHILGSKLHIDSCVKTVLANLYKKNGYTCRAGVNHVSLWPDGNLTGCPYRMPGQKYAQLNGFVKTFLDGLSINEIVNSEWSSCTFSRIEESFDDQNGLEQELYDNWNFSTPQIRIVAGFANE